jgi:hypothetical protein
VLRHEIGDTSGMGDRANVYLRNDNSGIGVYGHWAGLGMAEAAMAVLANDAFRKRLGDASYATRIAVQTIFAAVGADPNEETGFGLWTSASGPDDNEYRFIVIDVDSGELFVSDDWKDPRPEDKLADPTTDAIVARMQRRSK